MARNDKAGLWIEITQQCEGAGRMKLVPGDRVCMGKHAAQAFINSGKARLAKAPSKAEGKGGQSVIRKGGANAEHAKVQRPARPSTLPDTLEAWKALGWPQARRLFRAVFNADPANYDTIEIKLAELARAKRLKDAEAEKAAKAKPEAPAKAKPEAPAK